MLKETENTTTVKHSLARTFLRVVLSIYFVVVVIVTLIIMGYQYHVTRTLIEQDLESTEKIFEKGLAEAIYNLDDVGLPAILDGMLEYPAIIGIKVEGTEKEEIAFAGTYLNQEGKPVLSKKVFVSYDTETNKEATESNKSVSSLFFDTFPIEYVDEGEKLNLGTATVYSSKELIWERVKGIYLLLIVNVLVVATALWIVFLWVSRKLLSQPLSILTNAVSQLNLDNLERENLESLEVHLDSKRRNELKILEEAFNRMVRNLISEKKTITAMTRTFEKFVPKQFLKRIAKEGISAIRLGSIESDYFTILFSDIRSFTSISEKVPAEEMFKFLNTYLAKMESEIEKHGGFVDKFIGDAVMALFDLESDAMEAIESIQAALGMQKSLLDFNEQHFYGIPEISMGIGIHSGYVRIGTLGSQTRMESTVIGDAVNTAARLESLTKFYNCKIIISSNTFYLIKSNNPFSWRELDSVKVKGKEKPITLYEIFDCDPEPIIQLKLQTRNLLHEGIQHYRDQNWDKAIDSFQECLNIFPEDTPPQIYLTRCTELRASPPGRYWEGVISLEHK